MNFVPQFELGTFIFAVASLKLTFSHKNTLINIYPQFEIKLFSFFFILIFFLIILGIFNANPVLGVLKSAIPFLILIWAYLIITPKIKSLNHFVFLICCSGTIWAFRLIYEGVFEFIFGDSLKWLRLTLVDADAVIPFPLIIIPLLFFSKEIFLTKKWRLFVLTPQIIIVIWSGYRSQLAMLLGFILFFIFLKSFQKNKTALLGLFFIGLSSVIVTNTIDFQSEENQFFSYQIKRFTEIQEEKQESGRALERIFALKTLNDHPIFGAGFGTPIPSSITYATTSVDDDYVIPENVVYMHNAYFYTLMTGGILFFLVYLSIWSTLLYKRQRLWLFFVVLSLMSFIYVEATFLQIHFNVFLACLFSIKKGKG